MEPTETSTVIFCRAEVGDYHDHYRYYSGVQSFHNGHKYLLEQAKGLKIVAMSGNSHAERRACYRGQVTRAQMAPENGADLVVELPFSQYSGFLDKEQ